MKCNCTVVRCDNYFLCQKCNRKILKKRKLNLSNNEFRKKNKCIEPEVIHESPTTIIEPELILPELLVIKINPEVINANPIMKTKPKNKTRRIAIKPEVIIDETEIKPKPKNKSRRLNIEPGVIKTKIPKLKKEKPKPKPIIVKQEIITTAPIVPTNPTKFKRVQPKSMIIQPEIEIIQPMKLKSLIQKNIKRCYECNKKIGLTGIQCRCQYYFCGLHRYPNEHKCTFDYVNMERKILTEKNIKLIPMKFDKI
jgi:hypothetical protein